MAGKKQAKERAGSMAGSDVLDSIREIRQYQFKHLCDRAKRLGAAGRHRRSMVEGLAHKFGMNIAEIEAHQQSDWQLILEQTKQQEKAAAALLKKKSARQRQAFRTITKHSARFEYKKGNPHTSICLWKAMTAPSFDFFSEVFSDGVVQTLPPIPAAAPVRVGQNIFRVNAEVIGRLPHDFHFAPVAALDMVTKHLFETTVPHGGSLSVTANCVPNGTIFLGAPGDLIVPGQASALVSLYLAVDIATVTGEIIHLLTGDIQTLGDILTIVDQEITASWDGVSSLIPVGAAHSVAYQITHNHLINVQAGDQVFVTTGFEVYLTAVAGATARATFAPQPFGLNVPMVLLMIDS